MELFTQQHGLWLKRASEGASSLMRALSNALYFTDIYHNEIQNQLIGYFNDNRGSEELAVLGLSELETCGLFLQNPSLPEFEHVNLEIASRVFGVKIKFYFVNNGILCGNLIPGSFNRKIKIFKLFDNHYESALPLAKRPVYALVQNVVLSIIEAVGNGSTFQLKNHNDGRFINIEYENWKQSSEFFDQQRKMPKVDYKRSLFTNFDNSKNAVHGSISNNDNHSLVNDSGDSVGSIIVSIMERRRRIKAVSRAKRSFERKLDILINSSDQKSIKASDSQRSETRNMAVINVPKPESSPPHENPLNEPLKGSQNFSTKIYGMSSNLNKPISILELNSIFGLDHKSPVDLQVNPFEPAKPAARFGAKRPSNRFKLIQNPPLQFGKEQEQLNEGMMPFALVNEISQHSIQRCPQNQRLGVIPELNGWHCHQMMTGFQNDPDKSQKIELKESSFGNNFVKEGFNNDFCHNSQADECIKPFQKKIQT
jgi:hypothetical protein